MAESGYGFLLQQTAPLAGPLAGAIKTAFGKGILEPVENLGEKWVSPAGENLGIQLVSEIKDPGGLAYAMFIQKFHGASQTEKAEIANRLGFDVMLLSPKAGGVGLTLTAANNVMGLRYPEQLRPHLEDVKGRRSNGSSYFLYGVIIILVIMSQVMLTVKMLAVSGLLQNQIIQSVMTSQIYVKSPPMVSYSEIFNLFYVELHVAIQIQEKRNMHISEF